MSEDDAEGEEDWFEQALRDDVEDADGEAPSDDGNSADSGALDGEGSDDDDGAGVFGESGADDGFAGIGDDGTAANGGAGFDDATDDSSFDDAGDGPFEGTADRSAFGDAGDGDRFAGDPDPGAESGGGIFDEDFTSAFGGGGGEDEFDDEEFETEIPRIDLGIAGLDRMIQGGVPQRHLMVAIGSAGTGKTTFGLQFLEHGLRQGENCVFITLEQSHEAILGTASEWGWDFDEYEAEDSLAVVDLDPVEMANSLDNIRGELPDLVSDFDADRLVLDSVSLLEMMYDQPAKRRTEVYDFTRSLKRAGVTTFLTSEASEDNAYASRHGIIEYLTDAVFVLKYVRAESRETRLAIEIQKIRNANHSRETKPYELTDEGISVYEQANIF